MDIGPTICKLVAEAASTDKVALTEKDVDFIPQKLEPGSICPNIAIELRTIGFPERKKMMDETRMRKLVGHISNIPGWPSKAVSGHDPILWVQFIDPDGVHV